MPRSNIAVARRWARTLASMKGGLLLLSSAAMHLALALLFLLALIWWPEYVGRPLSAGVIAISAFLAIYCAFLALALLKARGGSPLWAKVFGMGGGFFLGNLTFFGGWKAAVIFAVPLVLGIAGVWRRKLLANHALESGRPQAGAAQRER